MPRKKTAPVAAVPTEAPAPVQPAPIPPAVLELQADVVTLVRSRIDTHRKVAQAQGVVAQAQANLQAAQAELAALDQEVQYRMSVIDQLQGKTVHMAPSVLQFPGAVGSIPTTPSQLQPQYGDDMVNHAHAVRDVV
jgi:hypothetical protein